MNRKALGIATILMLSTSGAAAQSIRITGSVGPSFGDGGAAIATSGAVAFALRSRVAVELEFATILGMTFSGMVAPLVFIFPPPEPVSLRESGRALVFDTSVVTDIPSGFQSLRVYIQGGAGIASVRRSRTIDGLAGESGVVTSSLSGGSYGAAATPAELDQTETALALSAGGGVDVRIWRGLAVGPEVRYFHLFNKNSGLNVVRVGARSVVTF